MKSQEVVIYCHTLLRGSYKQCSSRRSKNSFIIIIFQLHKHVWVAFNPISFSPTLNLLLRGSLLSRNPDWIVARVTSAIHKLWWCKFSNNNSFACTTSLQANPNQPPCNADKAPFTIVCRQAVSQPQPPPQNKKVLSPPSADHPPQSSSLANVLWNLLLMDGKDSLRGKFGWLMTYCIRPARHSLACMHESTVILVE